MHIAFIVPHLGGGGAERSVLGLATGLIERGHSVDLVLLQTRIYHPVPQSARLFVVDNKPDKPTQEKSPHLLPELIELSTSPRLFERLRMMSILKWDPFCLPSPHLVLRSRALASYMTHEMPDCVLPNVLNTEVATLLAARLLTEHAPIIPIVRGFVGYHYRYRHRRRYRRLCVGATHFVAVSQGVSNGLTTDLDVSSDRITTIYNPVVTPELHVKMAEPPSHPWVLDGGEPVVLAAGRLNEQKDYPTLLKAFGRLAARRPCRLIILGEGKRRKEIEELVGELDLTDRVSLPGWVENPFALMSRAALFVLSSIHEGLPRVLVEAMACGCPCVSTDCPAGPAEILEDGRYGPLVPVGDEAALAEAMDRVLDQPPEKPVLRQRAAYFSADRAVTAYENLISSVLQECVSS